MNRRQSERLKIDAEVIINNSVHAEGLDLSMDGMYIYSNHTFLRDSIINLSFDMGGESLNICAKVLHSQPGIGFGINFFDFPEDMRKKITDLVSMKTKGSGKKL